jgi:hypothetical protein
MKIRSLLLTTAATTGIAFATLTVTPVIHPETFATHAATSVSINIGIGTFYDRLAPHGDWVSYRGRFVWVPHYIDAGWRPYTVGHWVYTKRHGWLWVSDEPFGWAVYHYGRWGYARDIGWYWVPGRRWAPAWVAWHRTDRDVAWAPLPPEWDDGEDVVVFYRKAPVHYWQVVPVNFFLSINISDHIIRDRDHVRRVVRESEPMTVHIENNIVVNNAIDVDFIEERTKKKVVVHEVKHADDPEVAGKAEEGTVAVFDPEVKEEPEAKPAKTKKAEEVAKERATSIPESAEDPVVEESTAPAEEKAPDKVEAAKTGEQPAAGQPVKKTATEGETTADVPEAADTQPEQDQPVKKKAATKGEATGEIPEAAETKPAEEQPVKKKAATEGEATGEVPEAAESRPSEDQLGKKQVITDAEAGQEPAPPKKEKQAKDQQAECDPNVQDCPDAN